MDWESKVQECKDYIKRLEDQEEPNLERIHEQKAWLTYYEHRND